MILKTHASSSSGNFYTIEDSGQTLFLECGVSIDEIKKIMNFDFSTVVGCLVSHEHSDHAKSIYKLLHLGVAVGSTASAMQNIKHHKKFVIEPNKAFKVGDFYVKAFKLVHDVDNFGYLIQTPSGKRILFATDTQYVMTQFNDIDVYMLECNFDLASMQRAVHCGMLDQAVLIRVSQTHMSLETMCAYLDSADLTRTKRIMLIHLSDGNSDEEKYIKTVQDLTGVKTIAALKGDVIELDEGPGF